MSIGKVEPGLQGAEGDLAVTVGPDHHDRGRDEVEVVALPDVGFDDPPAAIKRHSIGAVTAMPPPGASAS